MPLFRHVVSLAAVVLLFVAGSLSGAEPESLLSNGRFEMDANGDGWPDDWPRPAGTSVQTEDGNWFLRLDAVPDKMLTVYRVVRVKPGVEAYAFSFKVRVNDLQRGKANWHDGRIILDFKDDAGKKLSPGPSHPSFKGTSKGWVEKRVDFLVPAGAAVLEIMPAMFMVKAGSLDLDDMTLAETDPAPILARIEEAKRKKAEDVARRAAKVKPQVPATPMDKMPPILHVDGNQIMSAKGEVVWLQGVSIPSMEWTNGGEKILQSVKESLENWNANAIRLCVSDKFWWGKGPYQMDGGAFQHQVVEDAINLAAAHGAYTILDLHRFRAPEKAHAEFWTDVATRYKNHPAVIFEIFNEPHDISWEVWRNGGFVSTEKTDANVVAENKEKLKGFESIGMQALVDAIRQTGAKNLIIAGGLDWGYDLSGIIQGYALDDRSGNGIGYVSHVYPWKSDWQGKFLDTAAKYPVVITECGAPKERLSFIPPEMHEDASTWVPDFLGLVQKYKLHWTAWSFHPKASPVLLKDWTYEPNEHWGIHAKRALAGEPYELKKLR